MEFFFCLLLVSAFIGQTHPSKFNRELANLVKNLLDYELVREDRQAENYVDDDDDAGVEFMQKKYHTDVGYDVDDGKGSDVRIESMRMPDGKPEKPDTYLCFSHRIPNDGTARFLVEFEPIAKMQVAHHMLLFGCSDDDPHVDAEDPRTKKKYWHCGEMMGVCNGGQQSILYAWGKNAPSLTMPDDTGFHVGAGSKVKYLVLQIHYLDVSSFKNGVTDHSGIRFKMTDEQLRYHAGIYFLGDGMTVIPPHNPKFHIDMGCSFDPDEDIQISPFRFRVHAHKLATVITAYRIRNGKWTLIGRGDPQRPQAFYKVFNTVDIKKGDKLVGRCTYNSMSRNNNTYIGATHNDEMCNFYIMYFYDSMKVKGTPYIPCGYIYANRYKYPSDSDVSLAAMEVQGRKLAKAGGIKNEYEFVENQYEEDPDWSFDYDISGINQITGVDVDGENVIMLHRGERVWGERTFIFDKLNRTLQKPIKNDTLVWLSRKTGDYVKSSGKNMFYMPHGITVDKEQNIFITDVGAHQVYKFSPKFELNLTLGVLFEPGNSLSHFCKPTDVAVMEDGSFFVADGYCNSRVVKFHADGTVDEAITKKLTSANFQKLHKGFPKPYDMLVVHSLAIDHEHNLLYVADRENQRVLVFNCDGDYKTVINHKFKGAVYGLAYNKNNGGVLHVVNGNVYGHKTKISGFTYSTSLHEVVADWTPKEGFGMPHDLGVTSDNKEIYVAEINPTSKLLKFTKRKAATNN